MFYINGTDIEDLGGLMLRDYTVSASPVTQDYNKPRNGTSFTVFGKTIGLKTITVTVNILGRDRREVAARKSALDVMAAAGQIEITLPDLFQYTSVLQNAGGLSWILPTRGECSYTFLAIQHDPLISVETAGILYAEGTMPEMSCRISVTAGAAAETYTVAGVTFTDIKAGDKIVIDGLNSRVLLNGGNAILRCDLVEFPRLAPGKNTIVAPDRVAVEYYPSYQ